MSGTQLSIGRQAYRLYNKVGATEKDKVSAQILIAAEKFEDLDIYGRFVYAEVIFWKILSTPTAYAQAIEIFQKIIIDKQPPKPLVIGACFFLGRMYELGLGTDYNMGAAYAHYRLANKLNPKACVKDIARLQKILNDAPTKINTSTPDKFKYHGDDETDSEWEYYQCVHEWSQEYDKCRKSLKDNNFFYPDDPDEVEVDFYIAPLDTKKDD